MTIAPMSADDVPALLLLASEYGQNTFMWSPGSAGVVARDRDGVAGFALLCHRPYGLVVDELWCAKELRGRRATSVIIDFVEAQMRIRGLAVGGIVREGSPLYAVLSKRGYAVTAHVLTKAVA